MSAARRLENFSRFLTYLHNELGLEIGFILWDGSKIPADLAPDALAINLADEGVVASLIRRPNLETLSNLWVTARIDILNGTFFDVINLRPKVRLRNFRKTLNKGLALSTLSKFLFVSRGGPWPLEAVPDDRPSDGSSDENRKNMHYHYDVSNAFYELWLDKELVYTCGYYKEWDNDIDQAQQDKLELICRKLRLKSGERMLDIGCGWGALSCYAAKHYGVTVHGVTLSEEQHAYAQEKIARLGLQDRVTIELKDYSTVEGEYDKVAAIGIHEHIGFRNYPTFYGTVKRVLKEDGLFLLHATTKPSKRDKKSFVKKNKETALLTKYIFPGVELDHIGGTIASLEEYYFEVHDVENLREHYQRTCKQWHDGLLANYDAAIKEVGEVTTRLWILYLAGCSIAYERNGVRLYQTLASNRRRGPSGLPSTRSDLYH